MLESLGMKEPALATLTREAYSLLDMTVYYTAGPKEIRAWQIPIGCPAPKAAGKLRVEGKTYVFKEGDVANFLFNV